MYSKKDIAIGVGPCPSKSPSDLIYVTYCGFPAPSPVAKKKKTVERREEEDDRKQEKRGSVLKKEEEKERKGKDRKG